MSQTLTNITNIISCISGIITILGVGGAISWSSSHSSKSYPPDQQHIKDIIISIFALGVKIGACIIVLAIATAITYGLYTPLAIISNIMITGGANGSDLSFQGENIWPSAIALTSSLLLMVPLYLLTCASILSSSFEPFKLFWTVIKKSNNR
ncbi:hypothetical protein [Photobacterium carnosum]|uniref:hypothetical protein n=1 Tax=Photobacterium carnosum TaxID=2023717 RepID=UPI001E650ABB|nr:hypothetical protein [Photobacterium carnosum]MCD9529587.1 hypothetical protein [Photobacterium carnosum]MCD9537382.1 hypothetical protein [Photobacterium carnosum]MCF2153468.1 hypothetical protein [Photobacterium carnosum]MCF2161928.1 hypothetical protein [Photobacterium carnosum]MCF2215309.1 hypothetical protein [Photobacterium carnosum]